MSKKKHLTHKFYMVRLSGGQWEPIAKHETLAKAIEEATRLSKEFNKPATVLASIVRIETIGNSVQLIDVNPEN
jgi:hypothetical protein